MGSRLFIVLMEPKKLFCNSLVLDLYSLDRPKILQKKFCKFLWYLRWTLTYIVWTDPKFCKKSFANFCGTSGGP